MNNYVRIRQQGGLTYIEKTTGMTKYYVISWNKGWIGKSSDSLRPEVISTTRTKAVRLTIELAKANKPSAVLVYNEEGYIVENRRFLDQS